MRLAPHLSARDLAELDNDEIDTTPSSLWVRRARVSMSPSPLFVNRLDDAAAMRRGRDIDPKGSSIVVDESLPPLLLHRGDCAAAYPAAWIEGTPSREVSV
ncbi:MAG TPA: hypothetical protein DEP35_08635, partial [Deltaproteobacteria bacterium]|nr:hypothetical protein [Deltaproteobacteria bacterium]